MIGSLITRRATAYLPAVDGLRAIAIAAVFIYHAHAGWLPGGYLGVDLFFAISGFLITRGLLDEHSERRGVDLKRFWIRRARRLLPAAFVFIFVLITAAQAFFPGDLRSLRGVALAAIGYATNWYLIFSEQSYFDTVGRPQLLQHLWSLAVEEQFYLVWPLALVGALRVLSRRAVFGMTVLLGLTSVVLMAMLYRGGADVSRLYYGTDTHAVGLLLGAALAFVEPVWRRSTSRTLWTAIELGGVAALVALVALFAWLGEARPFLYEGGFLLAALVSLALIVPASTRGRFAAVIGSGPLRWVGVRSYGIYLWHPALLGLVGAMRLDLPAPVMVGLAALATVLVADLSFRWVELPIRSGTVWHVLDDFRQLRRDTRWVTIAASTAAITVVVAGAIIAPAATPPSYLTVSQVSGVLNASTREASTSAPSWVVPRDAVTGSSAESVSRAVVPASASRTPDATVASTASTSSASMAPSEGGVPIAPASASITPITTVSSTTPVFALGDSVMLGAANGLAAAFGTIEVDAAVGRDVATTLRILRERRAARTLPPTVIVQIGNNGPITRPQMDELMQTLSGVQRVVLIDLHVPLAWESANNAMISDAVSRNPNARLVSWHAASDARGDIFWDNIHLRPEGVALYVNLIAAKAE